MLTACLFSTIQRAHATCDNAACDDQSEDTTTIVPTTSTTSTVQPELSEEETTPIPTMLPTISSLPPTTTANNAAAATTTGSADPGKVTLVLPESKSPLCVGGKRASAAFETTSTVPRMEEKFKLTITIKLDAGASGYIYSRTVSCGCACGSACMAFLTRFSFSSFSRA